jgi:hypothetical protein
VTVRRLVQHDNPEGRETPLLLLADLRAIDQTIELVYFGARDWRLGSVRPNDRRTKGGAHILKMEEARDAVHRNPKNIMLGKLLLQGFSQIAQYHDQGDPSGVVLDEDGQETTILADFSARQAAWLQDGGESVAYEMDQYLAQDGREHYRRIVRGRSMFGPAGQTGGDRALIHTP